MTRDVASLRRVKACGRCQTVADKLDVPLDGPDRAAVALADTCDACAARIVACRDRAVRRETRELEAALRGLREAFEAHMAEYNAEVAKVARLRRQLALARKGRGR